MCEESKTPSKCKLMALYIIEDVLREASSLLHRQKTKKQKNLLNICRVLCMHSYLGCFDQLVDPRDGCHGRKHSQAMGRLWLRPRKRCAHSFGAGTKENGYSCVWISRAVGRNWCRKGRMMGSR